MHDGEGHSGRQVEGPRRLKASERDILHALLGYADFDGRDALLEQVDGARVVGRCRCGCATVDLDVDGQQRGESVSLPIPNQADVIGPDGESIGGVLLFVADGKLATLEIYSNRDEPINPLPSVSELDIHRLPI